MVDITIVNWLIDQLISAGVFPIVANPSVQMVREVGAIPSLSANVRQQVRNVKNPKDFMIMCTT